MPSSGWARLRESAGSGEEYQRDNAALDAFIVALRPPEVEHFIRACEECGEPASDAVTGATVSHDGDRHPCIGLWCDACRLKFIPLMRGAQGR